jgi:peptide/nickel transport system permease protein
VLVIVAGVFSPWLTPHDPLRGNLLEVRVPPAWAEGGSSKYLLGTDPLGRDIFSRLIEGARVSLTVASIVLGIGAISGITLGMIAGYFGGQLDEIIMRIVDFALAVPFILVALVVVIVLGQSLTVIIVLLAFFSWPGFARQVRAETLSLKRRDYVALAQIAGASPERILFRHILPGVTNTAVVVATLRVGQLILVESTLSFLGVGIPPPTPAWGSMTADGRDYLLTEWWISFFPGLAIVIVVASLNFFGDWLRDYLDPRLRQIGR